MQKHQSVTRSSRTCPGMKKHRDASTRTAVRIRWDEYGFVDVETCLYISDPNIMEHMSMAKMRPNGSSVTCQH
jgi:hypothetical protein